MITPKNQTERLMGNKIRRSKLWKAGDEENKINLDDLQKKYLLRK